MNGLQIRIVLFPAFKKDGDGKPEPVEENAFTEQVLPTFSPAKKDKFTGLAQNHCVVLIAAVGILAGAWAIWKVYLSPGIKVVSVNRMQYILSDKPSIAVLPFVNLSEDHGQEFFSDGMTEDTITNLSKVSVLCRLTEFNLLVQRQPGED